MSHVALIDPDNAQGEARELLDVVKGAFGVVPNMTRAMVNAPALLKGYLEFSGALGKGVLGAPLAERIALTVAQSNGCNYCLSVHSYIAENVAGLSKDQIQAARKASAEDDKTAAILALAAEVNEQRGSLSADTLAAARRAGVSDQEIAETIGHVALNVLTNFFNKAMDVDVEFPLVTPTT